MHCVTSNNKCTVMKKLMYILLIFCFSCKSNVKQNNTQTDNILINCESDNNDYSTDKMQSLLGKEDTLTDLPLYDLNLISFPIKTTKFKKAKKINLHSVGLTCLPDTFACFKHLEYLHLGWNNFEQLPTVISNLK